ncbi:agmatine deiminase family protein [Flammeovirga yaeyamensis]|uniref:Agmatine deiminase family protein n=1 Tax=Flammeovirga yaeyamensis TaxID=367791 RepID=A0AAX1N1T7_9BACT|nr:agmatine deiminase family protein [Flammeovirga yaeyamensis]MBB3698182.1 agmatine deiminase [Flammeovirga yaeyamensis]NMF34462.1 agmatine deiminase family protein [Flammeovirga yaeyamensis]QWG01441.1 agmatine deiminase family protein [Flammeovirga yaeyamensis]
MNTFPTVHFSEKLEKDYPQAWQTIKKVLNKHSISYRFLLETKDIWCRDYMPIKSNDGTLVQFKYMPSYLKNYTKLKSKPQEVNRVNRIAAIYSDLNVDGGNVELHDGIVFLTERVFSENPKWSREQVIEELTLTLKAKPYFVKDQKKDIDTTGHVDGHFRVIKTGEVVVNDFSNDDEYVVASFKKIMNELKWKYTMMPWFEEDDKPKDSMSAIGIYTNFLVIDNIILFPIFEVEGNKDAEALEVIKELYPNKIIEPININSVVKEGGLINCITWVN